MTRVWLRAVLKWPLCWRQYLTWLLLWSFNLLSIGPVIIWLPDSWPGRPWIMWPWTPLPRLRPHRCFLFGINTDIVPVTSGDGIVWDLHHGKFSMALQPQKLKIRFSGLWRFGNPSISRGCMYLLSPWDFYTDKRFRCSYVYSLYASSLSKPTLLLSSSRLIPQTTPFSIALFWRKYCACLGRRS